MCHVRLRPATRADDAFFRRMEFDTTWHSMSEADRKRLGKEWVRDSLDATHAILLERPGNQIVIAENDEGERVGLLWFGINRNLVTGDDEAWIYNISVVPEAQGLGVGKHLMQHAEELARKSGHGVLGLMVSSHNTRARALYEKLEFHPTNLIMRKQL